MFYLFEVGLSRLFTMQISSEKFAAIPHDRTLLSSQSQGVLNVNRGVARPNTSLTRRSSILRNIAACEATVSCSSTFCKGEQSFFILLHFSG